MRVRIKTVYYGKSRMYISSLFERHHDNFSYVLNLAEVNCAKGEYKILYTALYDNEDKLLLLKMHEKNNWKRIPGNLDIGELSLIMCS